METVVRVTWDGGRLLDRSSGTGRRRVVHYDASAVTDRAQAEAIGDTKLAELTTPRRSYAVKLADPAAAPNLGDAATFGGLGGPVTLRCRGLRITYDANGVEIVTPIMGSPAEDVAERTRRELDAMTNGTGRGRFSGATPNRGGTKLHIPTGTLRAPHFPRINQDPAQVKAGPPFKVEEWTLLTWVRLMVDSEATSGQTVGRIVRDGVELGGGTTVSLGTSGTEELVWLSDVLLEPGQAIVPEITDVGEGVGSLTYFFGTAPGMLTVA